MLRRTLPRRALASLVKCETLPGAAGDIRVSLSDGRTPTLCKEWLLDNVKSNFHRTGQRTKHVGPLAELPTITGCDIAADGSAMRLALSTGEEEYVSSALIAKYAVRRRITPVEAAVKDTPWPLYQFDKVVAVPEGETPASCSDDLYRLLHDLATQGAVTVENVPLSVEGMETLTSRIGPVQNTLYGMNWEVRAQPCTGPKNNIAYTGLELDLHNDLAYYESMPGLQVLHCLKFNPDVVTGGRTTFMDGYAVAQRLREEDPEAFQTLCDIPAAFMTDDMDRAIPAQYYYATPHFQTCPDTGCLIKVVWAPPFEAPIPAEDPDKVRRYYAAKHKFTRLMNEMKATHLRKLTWRPGLAIIWNQTRVLHGRDSFTEPEPGHRSLVGCYSNIDDFRNRLVAECVRRGDPEPTMPLGNRSWR